MMLAQIVGQGAAPVEPLLPGTGIIVNAISKIIRSGMRLYAGQVASMANTQIDRAQRFWRVELEQAAEYLAENFGPGSGYGGASIEMWRIALGNNFTWRVVPVIACRPGYEIDDISRACVEERRKTTPPPADLTPPADLAPPPVKAGTPVWLIGAAAVVGLLLFRK